jgi:regulator of replication initiation timing
MGALLAILRESIHGLAQSLQSLFEAAPSHSASPVGPDQISLSPVPGEGADRPWLAQFGAIAELASARLELGGARERARSLELKLAGADREIGALRARVGQLSSQLSSADEENAVLGLRVEQLKRDLAQKEGELTAASRRRAREREIRQQRDALISKGCAEGAGHALTRSLASHWGELIARTTASEKPAVADLKGLECLFAAADSRADRICRELESLEARIFAEHMEPIPLDGGEFNGQSLDEINAINGVIRRVNEVGRPILEAVETTVVAINKLRLVLDRAGAVPPLDHNELFRWVGRQVSDFVNGPLATGVARSWATGDVPEIGPLTLAGDKLCCLVTHESALRTFVHELNEELAKFVPTFTRSWSKTASSFTAVRKALPSPTPAALPVPALVHVQVTPESVPVIPHTQSFDKGSFKDELVQLSAFRPRSLSARDNACRRISEDVISFTLGVCHALNNAEAQRIPLRNRVQSLMCGVKKDISEILDLGEIGAMETPLPLEAEEAIRTMLSKIEVTVLNHNTFRQDAQRKQAHLQTSLQQAQSELQRLREGRLAELKYIRGRSREKIEKLKALHQSEIEVLVHALCQN